ncbi:transglutaminase domain-containing protein [Aquincola sp. S2]|uniref:Transglutaminase domain-containing protein n=1 Tax=Pseudaquabacterium terrae TaxID=2732868 RepID=A0ABX2ED57_9BURK|nr:transglutaminase domain-containing protein [Aquabacterium terrae]NRF66524.1 transglutaminase domain-containing protein [Aquabacterium terrae]
MKRALTSVPAIAATLIALLALLAYVAQHARPSTEAVRLRNALLWDKTVPMASLDWTPAAPPADYLVDPPVRNPAFDRVAAELRLAELGSDWERALVIARHLLDNPRKGNAAQDDLAGTYRQILQGGGYCADYTTTFIAIARSAGMFVREWAFSFDGYGGHGHAFVELYDAQAKRWRFIDAFNNFYVIDAASREPLSAAELRAVLRGDGRQIAIVKPAPGRLGFRNELDLYEYYRQGADQWYLWWGNAVLRYDESFAVQTLGRLSRTLEQLGAIALGVHPRIHAVESDTNQGLRQRMASLKGKLLLAFAGGAALALLLLGQLVLRRRGARKG